MHSEARCEARVVCTGEFAFSMGVDIRVWASRQRTLRRADYARTHEACARTGTGVREAGHTWMVFVAIMNWFCGIARALFTSPAWLICCTTCEAHRERVMFGSCELSTLLTLDLISKLSPTLTLTQMRGPAQVCRHVSEASSRHGLDHTIAPQATRLNLNWQ